MKTRSISKHIFITLGFALFILAREGYSQKTEYIITDSSLVLGVELSAGGARANAQYIKQKVKGDEITYLPTQILEYGFKDGTVYESKKIILDGEEKSVFLERLATGRIKLYKYTGKGDKIYYLRKDSSDLLEIQKDLSVLKQLSADCENMGDVIRIASYNKRSLQQAVSFYNKCEKKIFQYNKFGILAGWRSTSLKERSANNSIFGNGISIQSSGSPVMGVFADLPFKRGPMSIHPELSYAWNSFAGSSNTAPQTFLDVVVNISTIQLPLLFRYTSPTPKWKFFIDAGPAATYNIRNSGGLYTSELRGNTVTIKKAEQKTLLDDAMFGYAVGAGLQTHINYRKMLSATFRYNSARGAKESTFVMNGIDLTIGFSF